MVPALKVHSFWRFSKPYPNTCTSIGSKIGCFHGRHWWYATGEALAEFNLVEEDFLNQLEEAFTDSCLSIVHFRLYLIGRTEASARPTIMFFCEEKEPRKKAKKAIEEAGFLKRLPGFRLGHQAKQPDIGSLIQPAVEHDGVQKHSRLDSLVDVYFDSAQPIRATGMPIFVKHNNNVIRRATANVVFHKEKPVYMSVAHVFQKSVVPKRKPADFDDEYDFGSGTEHEDDDECVEATSRGSMSVANESIDEQIDLAASASGSGSGSSALMNENVLTQRITSIVRPPLPPQPAYEDSSPPLPSSLIKSLEFLGCLILSSVEFDCALIQIKNIEVYSKICAEVQTTQKFVTGPGKDHLSELTAIRAYTSHGSISGHLSSNATYMRLPGSLKFQKVFQITLKIALDWGDCGTIIANPKTMEPYGYVIASSKNKLVAYIMKATKIFATMGIQREAPMVTSAAEFSTNSKNKESSFPGEILSLAPPGYREVAIHGSCPRCHHYHSAVKISIPISYDSSQSVRINCERCRCAWLHFGDRNSSQISLLSTLTIEPDPTETQIRSRLIDMVKSVPDLENIRDQSLSSPSKERLEHSRNLQTPSLQTEHLQQLEREGVPIITESRAKSNAKPPRQNLKQKLRSRLQSHVKQVFRKAEKPKRSGKALGKLPVATILTEEVEITTKQPVNQGKMPVPSVPVTHAQDTIEQLKKYNPEKEYNSRNHELRQQAVRAISHNDESNNTNVEAVHFHESIMNDPLELMDKQERFAWIRQTLTRFKSHRNKSAQTPHIDNADKSTEVSPQDLLDLSPPRRRSNFLGLGSHFGMLDNLAWNSEGSIESSNDHRTETIVDGISAWGGSLPSRDSQDLTYRLSTDSWRFPRRLSSQGRVETRVLSRRRRHRLSRRSCSSAGLSMNSLI